LYVWGLFHFLRCFPFGGSDFYYFDQGHHMAVVLEERCSREVICRDEPIEALKKENETLEEVKGFSST
jgi:hypothetical protein